MQKTSIITYLIASVSAILLSGCMEETHISFFCEKDKKNNYIIKWELTPEKKEDVKIEIFSSDNDSIFPKEPRIVAPVNDYVSIISPAKGVFREYFRLKVNKSYSGIVSNRFFNNKNIQNFRDIGGYFTQNNEQMRWGKIYRSGDISNPAPEDIAMLDSLQIRTVVDLRNKNQIDSHPDKTNKGINHISLPVNVNCFNTEIRDRILDGSFLKGDAIIHTQDCYCNIINEHSEEYAKLFDILCNEDSYPLLFHCGWGKDKSGLAAYFILKALGINQGSIEEDYLYSNQGINRKRILKKGEELPETVQEAITTMSTCDISQLKYAISCMKKKSGSVEEYMQKNLKITPQKIAKLKEILLYK